MTFTTHWDDCRRRNFATGVTRVQACVWEWVMERLRGRALE